MRDIHKYFYALFTACFIGIGSGFVALFPFAMEYESNAVRAGYQLEQATGLDYQNGIVCSDFPEIQADCNYAQYLLRTNTDTAEILKNILYFLTFLGLMSGVAGLYFQQHKTVPESAQ